jgi:trehalose 2-sulfotransferase
MSSANARRLLIHRAAYVSASPRGPSRSRAAARAAPPLSAPGVSYIVCTNPRSGSWLLCEGLASTRVAGNPREWFNPLEEQAHRAGWRMTHPSNLSHAAYLDLVRTQSTTSNGVSGTKLHYYQFAELLETSQTVNESGGPTAEPLSRLFPDARHVWLTRRDKAQQAISLLLAEGTQEWWRIDGISRARESSVAPLQFDPHVVARVERDLQESDRKWQAYFAAHDITPHVIHYEDLAADYSATIQGVLRWLGVAEAVDVCVPPPRLKRQADTRNQDWLARYERFKHEGGGPADDAGLRETSFLTEKARSNRSIFPDLWKQWVAQAMQLNSSDDAIVEVLVSNGFTRAAALAEVRSAAAHPYVLGAIAARDVPSDVVTSLRASA